MPDYKKLYYRTFNAITDAERLVKQAFLILATIQQQCENTVIEAEDAPISLADATDKKELLHDEA